MNNYTMTNDYKQSKLLEKSILHYIGITSQQKCPYSYENKKFTRKSIGYNTSRGVIRGKELDGYLSISSKDDLVMSIKINISNTWAGYTIILVRTIQDIHLIQAILQNVPVRFVYKNLHKMFDRGKNII